MLQVSTLKFLRSLKKNNNKAWFDANRDKYEEARKDFGLFIQAIIDRHGSKDASIAQLTAKECMFRINRDIRFSKDKSPYKSNFGASINPGGKKSIFAGYYFHCEPGDSFVGGGLWIPMPPDLKKVRQEIDYCLDEFTAITGSRKIKKIYGDLYAGDDVSLTKVPQGFEKDNPAAGYLKLKSFIAMKPLKDDELISKQLLRITGEAFDTLQPMLEFINRALKH
jgi:uncharacterized protein (TIGR02453 family)